MTESILHFYSQLSSQDKRKQVIPVLQERRYEPSKKLLFKAELNPKLKSDIDTVKHIFAPFMKLDKQVKTTFTSTPETLPTPELAIGALNTIPYYRRLFGVEEAIRSRDYIKALGKAMILFVNIPEDTRDIKAAAKQLRKLPTEIPNDFQVKFSFFRGTMLDPILKKLDKTENKLIKKILNKLYRVDKTVFDTKFGEAVNKLLKLEKAICIETTRKDFRDYAVKAIKLEGKPLANLIGRSMLRIPVLGWIVLSSLEIPAVIRAFSCKDNLKDNLASGTKQMFKSGISVTSMLSGGAILGAICSKQFGPTGSLIGLGVGSYLGSKTGSLVNKQIDKL